MEPPPTVEYVEAPAAAPNGAGDTDRTSSTLAEVHGEAKQSLDP